MQRRQAKYTLKNASFCWGDERYSKVAGFSRDELRKNKPLNIRKAGLSESLKPNFGREFLRSIQEEVVLEKQRRLQLIQ